jgi:hypothetical protein
MAFFASRTLLRAPSAAIGVSLVVLPATAQAQDVPQDFKNFLAYLALAVTPPGALPPLLTRSMMGPRAGGPGSPLGVQP